MKYKFFLSSLVSIIILALIISCINEKPNKIKKSRDSKYYSTKIVDGKIQKDTLFFEDFEYYDTAGIIVYRLVLFGGYNMDTIWGGPEKELNGKTYRYDSKGELINVIIIKGDTTFYYDENDEVEQYIIKDEIGSKELRFDVFRYLFTNRKIDEFGNIIYYKSQCTYVFTEDDYKRMNADEIAKREEMFNKITIAEYSYEYY